MTSDNALPTDQCLNQLTSEMLLFFDCIGINTGTHNWTLYGEGQTLEHSSLNEMSSQNLNLQGSGACAQEKTERLQKPEVMDNSKETVFYKHN